MADLSDFPESVVTQNGALFEIIPGSENKRKGPHYTRNGITCSRWYTLPGLTCFSPINGLSKEEMRQYEWPTGVVATLRSA